MSDIKYFKNCKFFHFKHMVNTRINFRKVYAKWTR